MKRILAFADHDRFNAVCSTTHESASSAPSRRESAFPEAAPQNMQDIERITVRKAITLQILNMLFQQTLLLIIVLQKRELAAITNSISTWTTVEIIGISSVIVATLIFCILHLLFCGMNTTFRRKRATK